MRKILVLMLAVFALNAAEMTIASGAGYKKMVLEILENFEKKESIDATFGNMRQITTQALNHDISLLIGDKTFFDGVEEFKTTVNQKVGNGKLVLVYPKEKVVKNLKDLEKPEFKKIAMPDAKKAIYGKAATQAIESANLDIKNKLIEVATVPQAASYVISGEVDAAFINLSEALTIKDKIGGILEVDQGLYSEIEIVVLELESCAKKGICKEFLDYLQTDKVKEIVTKYGL
ncbi:MAG: molybdate ABC transporter substrate-binding protein [Campylobacteraceae bacterium]|nr:molybdate ABC transporter substrate-binding protein [Campylobacteraceae bacterium]